VSAFDDVAGVDRESVTFFFGDPLGEVKNGVFVELADVHLSNVAFRLFRALESVFAEWSVQLLFVFLAAGVPAPASMTGTTTVLVGSAAVST
jgi:hypothetical protein